MMKMEISLRRFPHFIFEFTYVCKFLSESNEYFFLFFVLVPLMCSVVLMCRVVLMCSLVVIWSVALIYSAVLICGVVLM